MSTEVVEVPQQPNAQAPALRQQEFTPLMLLQEAVAKGADANQLSKLTDLYERWQSRAAAESFQRALVSFRTEVRPIIKDTPVGYDSSKPGGSRTEFSYASLHSIDSTITPVLSKYGLTATWKIIDQAKDWIKVRCTLTHLDGHKDVAELGGPPDKTGGKNDVQAIGSTVSLLERYTLIAVCGLTTREQDDDGNGSERLTPGKLVNDALIPMLQKAANDASALVVWKVGNAALKALGETEWAEKFKDSAVEVRRALPERTPKAEGQGAQA